MTISSSPNSSGPIKSLLSGSPVLAIRKNCGMLNPNDIREIAVLTHESIVRSNASRVRSTASLVAGLALIESPPARSVTESDPRRSDQGRCAHEPARESRQARQAQRANAILIWAGRPLRSRGTPAAASQELCARRRGLRPHERAFERTIARKHPTLPGESGSWRGLLSWSDLNKK